MSIYVPLNSKQAAQLKLHHHHHHHHHHSLLPHKSSLDRGELSVQILASRVHTIMMPCGFILANVGGFSLRSSILDVEPIYTFRGHRCVMSFYLSRECHFFHQNWKRASEMLPVSIAWGGMNLSFFCNFTDLALSRHIEALLYSSHHHHNHTMPITWISLQLFPVIFKQGTFLRCLPKSKK